MKKNRWLLLVLLLLVGVAGYTYWQKQQEQKALDAVYWDRDFKIEDLSSIKKVFLATRKNGQEVTLERKGKEWICNGSFRARQSVVDNMLDAINKMQVLYVPREAAIENIVKGIASNSIKVEIYGSRDKLLKTYYMGPATNKNDGNYVMMEGSNRPFVVHMPNMEGIVRARFEKRLVEWRDLRFITENPENITDVSVEYPTKRELSFQLSPNKNGSSIKPFYENLPAINKPIVEDAVRSYMAGFEEVFAESFIPDNNIMMDSITQVLPFARVSYTLKDKTTQKMSFHAAPAFDRYGNPVEIDKERYIVKLNGDEMILVQTRNVGKLLAPYSFFFDKK